MFINYQKYQLIWNNRYPIAIYHTNRYLLITKRQLIPLQTHIMKKSTNLCNYSAHAPSHFTQKSSFKENRSTLCINPFQNHNLRCSPPLLMEFSHPCKKQPPLGTYCPQSLPLFSFSRQSPSNRACTAFFRCSAASRRTPVANLSSCGDQLCPKPSVNRIQIGRNCQPGIKNKIPILKTKS